MLLKLTYSRASDQHQTVTVLGDPDGIRDLDGDVAVKVMEDPCRYATNLSYLDR